jgi:hypothetical protein
MTRIGGLMSPAATKDERVISLTIEGKFPALLVRVVNLLRLEGYHEVQLVGFENESTPKDNLFDEDYWRDNILQLANGRSFQVDKAYSSSDGIAVIRITGLKTKSSY